MLRWYLQAHRHSCRILGWAFHKAIPQVFSPIPCRAQCRLSCRIWGGTRDMGLDRKANIPFLRSLGLVLRPLTPEGINGRQAKCPTSIWKYSTEVPFQAPVSYFVASPPVRKPESAASFAFSEGLLNCSSSPRELSSGGFSERSCRCVGQGQRESLHHSCPHQ